MFTVVGIAFASDIAVDQAAVTTISLEAAVVFCFVDAVLVSVTWTPGPIILNPDPGADPDPGLLGPKKRRCVCEYLTNHSPPCHASPLGLP